MVICLPAQKQEVGVDRGRPLGRMSPHSSSGGLTRQVVAFVVGDRSEKTCRLLWQAIPTGYRRATLYSDFWEAYQKVLPDEQHEAVGKQCGQTNHVERWNNTLRQRVGRFVRKTLSFSKCDQMHLNCLSLFVHHYNLSRLTT